MTVAGVGDSEKTEVTMPIRRNYNLRFFIYIT